MKWLMDADCLIKLTKAGLKEWAVAQDRVSIPAMVKSEVVDAGIIKNAPDALVVRENIERGKITVLKGGKRVRDGDMDLIQSFDAHTYDAVATDDAKLIRFLKASGIPYVLPGILIYLSFKEGSLNAAEALSLLKQLAPFISAEQYGAVSLLLRGDES